MLTNAYNLKNIILIKAPYKEIAKETEKLVLADKNIKSVIVDFSEPQIEVFMKQRRLNIPVHYIRPILPEINQEYFEKFLNKRVLILIIHKNSERLSNILRLLPTNNYNIERLKDVSNDLGKSNLLQYQYKGNDKNINLKVFDGYSIYKIFRIL